MRDSTIMTQKASHRPFELQQRARQRHTPLGRGQKCPRHTVRKRQLHASGGPNGADREYQRLGNAYRRHTATGEMGRGRHFAG